MKKQDKKEKKVKVNNLLDGAYVRAADIVKDETGISKTAQIEKALSMYYATHHKDILTKHGIDLWRQ